MIIRTKAFPRAGLIGNPSDGYFGKTISFTFSNFSAEVVLYQTPELAIIPSVRDHGVFGSVEELASDVRLYGYYGGIRLIKATIKRFYDYCLENRIMLDKRNFTIRYSSNIPHRVGLAGSSAIITATLRAICAFFQVTIPKAIKASLILSVEMDELQISAGLQDRVAQVYEGLTYMDFNREHMESQGYGIYESLDPTALPPLYIAYKSDLSEGSEVFHNNIRERFNRGEKKVIDAMKYWGNLTTKAKTSITDNDPWKLHALIDANFDKRMKLYKISSDNIDMIQAARSCGASAKFTGSGGAIVGTYKDETMFKQLKKKLEQKKIKVIKPKIISRSKRGVKIEV